MEEELVAELKREREHMKREKRELLNIPSVAEGTRQLNKRQLRLERFTKLGAPSFILENEKKLIASSLKHHQVAELRKLIADHDSKSATIQGDIENLKHKYREEKKAYSQRQAEIKQQLSELRERLQCLTQPTTSPPKATTKRATKSPPVVSKKRQRQHKHTTRVPAISTEEADPKPNQWRFSFTDSATTMLDELAEGEGGFCEDLKPILEKQHIKLRAQLIWKRLSTITSMSSIQRRRMKTVGKGSQQYFRWKIVRVSSYRLLMKIDENAQQILFTVRDRKNVYQ